MTKCVANQSNYTQLYDWLCNNNSNNNQPIISHLINLYKTKYCLRNSITLFLSSYCLPYVCDIVLDIVPNYLDELYDYISFLHGILDKINSDIFKIHDFEQMYELTLSIKESGDYMKMCYTLPYIYMEITRLVDCKNEKGMVLVENCINELKRLTRNINVDIQIISLSCLLHLLDLFTRSNNSFAPLLYKTIIFAFLETRKYEFTHKYLTGNLISLLQGSLSVVPIGILIEPFAKQNQMYTIDNYDLQLLYVLSSHPMLTANQGVIILDSLKDLLFCDKIQSPIASLIFTIILLRFNDDNILVYINYFRI